MTPWNAAVALIRRYFELVWRIVTRPAHFFSSLPLREGLSVPLAFALVTHWLGSALSFLWRAWIGGALSSYFSHMLQMAGDVAEVDSPGRGEAITQMKDQLMHWFWGTGSIVADPFLTLFSILFTSFFVFIGARLLVTPAKNGAPEEITYESAVRVICYGMAPALLGAIPLFGTFLAGFLTVIITIIAAKEVYRVGVVRATVIALFPKVLLFGIIFFGLILAAFAMVRLVTLSF